MGLVFVMVMGVSCHGPLLTRAGSGGRSGAGLRGTADGLTFEEYLALEGWQSRLVTIDSASVGPTVRLVYQVPGEGDLTTLFLYPTATNKQMVLALKHAAKMPLQVAHLWRNNSVVTPSSVTRREIDPAPTMSSAYRWNPALENLQPGNTVLAVWPTSGGNASFDPISTNFRARLVLVLPPKP